MMKALGYVASKLDGTELEFKPSQQEFPKSYFVKFNAPVINQGSIGCCVSCAVYEMMTNYDEMRGSKYPYAYDLLYYRRENKSIDGMSPKEAFEMLKSDNLIKNYAKIGSLLVLKSSLIINGSALIALYVRDDIQPDFWDGNDKLGGHAVAVVGFDERSLIIKNSWGKSYGNGGYGNLPYDAFDKVLEAWTILN